MKKMTRREMLKNKIVSAARFLVSVFNGYYRLHYLTIIIILVLVLFSGKIFKLDGLLIVGIFLFYSIIYFLDKWLKKIDSD